MTDAKPLSGMRILVVGASIAGPTAAHQLAGYGAQVTVVEQAPALRTGGQLVDLRGVGREVIRRMGVDAGVRAAAEPNEALTFIDRRSRRNGRMAADDFGGDGPIAEIEIMRGELSRVIVSGSPAQVDYRFGDKVADLRQDEHGVDVTFASGRADRFDLLIGSDGIHSDVRRRVFDDDDVRVHLDTYVAFWTAENHLGLVDESVMYSEPGRSIGMRTILGGSKVMAFFTFRGGEPAYHYRDTETQKRITELRGAGMGWEAAPLLAQLRTADDFYFDACAQIKLDSWARGRVGLIGDAAYCASPLSGHGATIAMVGGYVLAGELATAGGDHTAAFARYRERLAPWITRIQDSAPGNGRTMTPETELGIWFRSTLTRLTERLPAKALLVRDQVKMSNAFVLPRYA